MWHVDKYAKPQSTYFISVSYTHLDVYKRQVFLCMSMMHIVLLFRLIFSFVPINIFVSLYPLYLCIVVPYNTVYLFYLHIFISVSFEHSYTLNKMNLLQPFYTCMAGTILSEQLYSNMIFFQNTSNYSLLLSFICMLKSR